MSKLINGICYDDNMNIVYVESDLSVAEIQEGTEKIGYDDFSCYRCKVFKIPSTVTFIDTCAFDELDSLEEIIVDENNPVFSSENGILYNKNKTKLIFCPYYNRNKVIEVPPSVEIIDSFAFTCNQSVSKVVMTNVKEIASHAFSYNEVLESVTTGNNLKVIGENAFEDCSKLINIKLSNCLETINKEVFTGCKSIINITLPDTVKHIGWGTFSSCKNLREVNIPPLLKEIPPSLFYGCAKLDNISLHSNINTIGSYAFAYCDSLTNIKIGKNVRNINDGAFFGCDKIEKIFISQNTLDKNPHFLKRYEDKIIKAKTLDMLLDEGFSFKEANEIFAENAQLDIW